MLFTFQLRSLKLVEDPAQTNFFNYQEKCEKQETERESRAAGAKAWQKDAHLKFAYINKNKVILKLPQQWATNV